MDEAEKKKIISDFEASIRSFEITKIVNVDEHRRNSVKHKIEVLMLFV